MPPPAGISLAAVLPQIFTGFRIAVGRALVIAVTTELIGGRNGLGNLIWMGWQTFAVEKLYTGVIATTPSSVGVSVIAACSA